MISTPQQLCHWDMMLAKMMTHPTQFGRETVPCMPVVMPLKCFVTVADSACTPFAFKVDQRLTQQARKSADLWGMISLSFYATVSSDQSGPSQQTVMKHQIHSEQAALCFCL